MADPFATLSTAERTLTPEVTLATTPKPTPMLSEEPPVSLTKPAPTAPTKPVPVPPSKPAPAAPTKPAPLPPTKPVPQQPNEPVPAVPPAEPPQPASATHVAIADFVADDLSWQRSVSSGDELVLVSDHGDGWSEVMSVRDGLKGSIPSAYMEAAPGASGLGARVGTGPGVGAGILTTGATDIR